MLLALRIKEADKSLRMQMRQPLEAGKGEERNSPLERLEGHQPCGPILDS